ncbi:MAG: phosphoribulokinase [Myxacorys californica WJT36-NPBG1]|nr:phosphoribulokinase [Myxacorys californica WJT36-NPBG1]
MSNRPIILGIVGDSAAGKTTLTKGIAQVLGEENVTIICTDDYHKYDRVQRAELGITALDPDCNHIDIMEQHLALLRSGQPILKPVYSHKTGMFEAPLYVKPNKFIIIEGLLGYSTRAVQDCYDVKVYLSPPESLRAEWKVKRDTQKRGYTKEQVLAELAKREPDSEQFIRPQRSWADIVVSFCPPKASNETNGHLDARLVLRPTIPHPELTQVVSTDAANTKSAIRLDLDRDMGKPVEILEVDGHATREQVRELEKFMCSEMPDLSAVCATDGSNMELGKVAGTTGETLQSYPLAITQLLIVYHMLKATK